MHTEEIECIVKAVLSLDMTDYKLAKALGYSNPSTINRLRRGEYDIDGLSLGRLKSYENYYNEIIKGE